MQPYTHFFSGIDKPYIPLIQPIQPYTHICIYIFNKKNNSCRVLGAPSFPKLNKNYYIIKPYIHLRCGGNYLFSRSLASLQFSPEPPIYFISCYRISTKPLLRGAYCYLF